VNIGELERGVSKPADVTERWPVAALDALAHAGAH